MPTCPYSASPLGFDHIAQQLSRLLNSSPTPGLDSANRPSAQVLPTLVCYVKTHRHSLQIDALVYTSHLP
ncbi:hypothetical protein ACT3T8_18080 [Halomonas sp. AOP1-B1-8]|uniref:hypothetical protein n=1 Tax=Halomonas sp. AOP1-B1-8 TaxID=3457726 RepID=UPI004034B903